MLFFLGPNLAWATAFESMEMVEIQIQGVVPDGHALKVFVPNLKNPDDRLDPPVLVYARLTEDYDVIAPIPGEYAGDVVVLHLIRQTDGFTTYYPVQSLDVAGGINNLGTEDDKEQLLGFPTLLQGVVFDTSTGEPLSGVTASTGDRSVSSDASGNFFLGVPVSRSVTISKIGYQEIVIPELEFSQSVSMALQVGFTAPGSLTIEAVDLPTFVAEDLPALELVKTVAYDSTVRFSGGRFPYNFSIVSGDLPTGLSLDSDTGRISGTPPPAGSYEFTVSVVDAEGTVVEREFIIEDVRFLQGFVYDTSTGEPLSGVTASTGDRSVSSDASGNFFLGVPVSRSVTISKIGYQEIVIPELEFSQSVSMALQVGFTAPGFLNVETVGLSAAETTVAYDVPLLFSGGKWPYVFSVAYGDLPPGLSLNPETGRISGTPTQPGSYTFSLAITDAEEGYTEREFFIEVTVPLTITTSILARGTRGADYFATLEATGGTAPYTFSSTSGGFAFLDAEGFESGGMDAGSWGGDWSVTSNEVHAGSYAAKAANVGHSTSTSMTVTLETGEGNLSFWYKVSSESEYDHLSFHIDNVEQDKWSGSVGWVEASYTLTAGTHSFKWKYSKDGSSSSGSDTAWVDDITFTSIVPFGLSLSTDGNIAGIPSSTGYKSFTAHVTDASGRTASATFDLGVDDPLEITTNRLNNGLVRQIYSQTLSAIGGIYAETTGYQWSLFSGVLPNGLTLDKDQITGTPTTASYGTIILEVRDDVDRVAYQDLTLQIVDPLEIITSNLPNALKNEPFSEMVRLQGGIEPFYFEYSGQLPDGLSLDQTTGVISGVPAAAGLTNLGITVTDSTWPDQQSASQALGIRTTSTLTILTSAVLPKSKKGVSVSGTMLTAAGGPPPYRWEVLDGALPTGVALDAQSGEMAGTLLDAGDYTVTIQVNDGSVPSSKNVSKEFYWHISDHLAVTTAMVPDAAQGERYNYTLHAQHGIQPYAWRVKSGELPDGLSLNETTGTLSGIPTNRQIRTFTIEVNDSDSPAQTVEQAYTVEVLNSLFIYTPLLANGQDDVVYTATLRAELGSPPYAWRLESGALPSGVTLASSATTATLTGTPTEPGSYTFTLEVRDSGTPVSLVTKEYTVEIVGELSIVSSILDTAMRHEAYGTDVVAAYGRIPYRFALTDGRLPNGLTLDSDSGRISGTPDDLSQNYNFTVRVTDGDGTQSERELAIQVIDPLTITTENIQSAMQWMPFEANLVASGGLSPHIWSVSGGSLPQGVNLDAATGKISGQSFTCGTVDFTLLVTDASQTPRSFSGTFQLEVLCSDDTDADDDGLPNEYEIEKGLNPIDPTDAVLDNDSDGYSNLTEYTWQADPNDAQLFPVCRLDIDGDGHVEALTDGVLIMRYLRGVVDNALTLGAVGSGAVRTSSQEIVFYLSHEVCAPMLDVDGSGQKEADRDGILIMRFLAGFTGDALVENAISSEAERSTPSAVTEFLNEFR